MATFPRCPKHKSWYDGECPICPTLAKKVLISDDVCSALIIPRTSDGQPVPAECVVEAMRQMRLVILSMVEMQKILGTEAASWANRRFSAFRLVLNGEEIFAVDLVP
jgi:hypothetical protein